MRVSSEYAAGLFDGEGYVGVFKQKVRNRYLYYGLQVIVQMREVDALGALHETWGGYLKQRPNKAGRKYWRWQLNSRSCREFLEDILPFSTVKKRQIELALEFISRVDDPDKVASTGVGRRRMSEREWQERDRIYLALKAEKR